jgi:hypothetical protein
MPPLRSLLVLLLAVFASGVARAHDPLESTVDLRITSDGLELTAVLSPPSATRLLKNPDAGIVSKTNFSGYRAELLTAAPRVCALLDADGKSLAPASTHLSLNREGEVTCLFVYPASTRPASLRSDLIASLGSGYFIAVTDHTVSPARRTALVRAKPACPLPVTASAP